MLPVYLLVAAAVLAATPAADAQDQVDQQNPSQVEQQSSPEPAPRVAIPRAEAPRSAPQPARAARPEPAPAPRREVAPPQVQPATSRLESTSPDPDEQRRAVPRGTRPRGDNPPVGTAVPRGARPAPAPPVDRGGIRTVDRNRTVVVRRPPVYNNYYYYPRNYYPYGYGYPRNYYPYGYGAFGLGYFYYDPYRWYPGSYSSYSYGYGGGGGGFYGGVYRSGGSYGSFFDVGELRLRVTPRHAQVFVDGYYAGIVDDYDGVLQSLKMETGPYHIEIIAPGYETLEFDVRINPGQKINYRGDLIPRP